MTRVDRKIREALQQEGLDIDPELFAEPSVHEMLTQNFVGRHWWLNIMGFIFTLGFLAFCVVSIVQFFSAETTRDQIMWCGATLICFISIAMLKIWFWMEIERHAITREIKRVELELARLASRLKAE